MFKKSLDLTVLKENNTKHKKMYLLSHFRNIFLNDLRSFM